MKKKDLENIINDKKSDKEMVNLAKKELSELLKKMINTKTNLKYFFYQKTLMIKKMQSLKFEQVPVV